MTRGITVEEGAPPQPVGGASFWADRLLRTVLLLIFIGAAGSVLLIGHAPVRDQAYFLQELDAGRVTTVAYDNVGWVRWAEGDWTWYRTVLDPGSPEISGPDAYGATTDRVRRFVQERVPPESSLELREVGTDPKGWLDWIAWGPLIGATGLAVLTTVVLAVLRPRRFASGWFWLIMLFGSVVGAPLYALLEPGPLWRREGWAPDRRRLGWPRSSASCSPGS
jgi:hypothetical protein